mmetsp:Transcript_134512/g.335588  ORF Transcript_134512/g.335588 Transcript_134512/m.335588 type:complete len:178 (-) Transcript_134512:430-963(-)
MARRGIANYDPPGSDQNDMIWWRQTLHHSRDGVPDASYALACVRSGPSNYVGMSTTARDSCKEAWTPNKKPWHPARVLADGLSEFDRAGKSSWHHCACKPIGRRTDIQTMASAGFTERRAPHLTAVDTPRVRQRPLDHTGFATGTAPLPSAAGGTEGKISHKVSALGFRTIYNPVLY